MTPPVRHTIGILGAGSWGTAMAQSFARNRHHVLLWHRSEAVARQIQHTRINQKYFPDYSLLPQVQVTSDLPSVMEKAHIIILAVPTSTLPHYLNIILPRIKPNQYILNASKGLDHREKLTFSQWIQKHYGLDMVQKHYGVLSGPTFALEVMQDKPCGIMLAMQDSKIRESLQSKLHASHLQVFSTHDVLGVEIAGALKNVIAITVGASDALGFGLNARAGLLTKGQKEISNIGTALGARDETFWGLAGIGDLILTCTGDLSRNRRVGKKLAEGKSIRQILKELGQIAEGVRTTKTLFEMTQELKLNTPILRETYRAIYQDKPLQEAVETILKDMT